MKISICSTQNRLKSSLISPRLYVMRSRGLTTHTSLLLTSKPQDMKDLPPLTPSYDHPSLKGEDYAFLQTCLAEFREIYEHYRPKQTMQEKIHKQAAQVGLRILPPKKPRNNCVK